MNKILMKIICLTVKFYFVYLNERSSKLISSFSLDSEDQSEAVFFRHFINYIDLGMRNAKLERKFLSTSSCRVLKNCTKIVKNIVILLTVTDGIIHFEPKKLKTKKSKIQ